MKRIIDVRDKNITVGSALRNMNDWHERAGLAYDPTLPARCNDLVLGEITTVLSKEEIYDGREDGVERYSNTGNGISFAIERIQPGLVVIPVGNRYAPKSLTGGLYNPVTGTPNGRITAGTTIFNLTACNLAGFINTTRPAGRSLTPIKVLGTLTEPDGRPLSLLNYYKSFPEGPRHSCKTVLVCGSMMESGKTSCCIAIKKALAGNGKRTTYEKKTGTACFSDPLRVLTGDIDRYGKPGQRIELNAVNLLVADFVDACGTVSDVSLDSSILVPRSTTFTQRFTAYHKPDVHIVELADNVAHSSNLTLLKNYHFRNLFTHLVYIPAPTFDGAFYFVHYIRTLPGWEAIRVAIGGELADDPANAVLQEEIRHRLDVPCLGRENAAGWVDWIVHEGG